MERKNNKIPKLHVKKGDMVQVISGDNKGDKGKVLVVYPKKGTAIVEKVNIVKRHTKPNAENTNGGIIEKEAAINVSKLMVIDNSGQPSRIGRKLDDDGNWVRYSKKSGEIIQ